MTHGTFCTCEDPLPYWEDNDLEYCDKCGLER